MNILIYFYTLEKVSNFDEFDDAKSLETTEAENPEIKSDVDDVEDKASKIDASANSAQENTVPTVTREIENHDLKNKDNQAKEVTAEGNMDVTDADSTLVEPKTHNIKNISTEKEEFESKPDSEVKSVSEDINDGKAEKNETESDLLSKPNLEETTASKTEVADKQIDIPEVNIVETEITNQTSIDITDSTKDIFNNVEENVTQKLDIETMEVKDLGIEVTSNESTQAEIDSDGAMKVG